MVALPLASFAQFFPPTDDELKMTTDPRAPGAAASILYLEQTVNDVLHFHTSYARIKVLTEKGKEQATVEIPYERDFAKISLIKARTIHSDGTIVPLDVKPTDLLVVKTKDAQINKVVFNLPSVEVGSILEYRWQLDYDDKWLYPPKWELQHSLFVHKAHYEFINNPDHWAGRNLLYFTSLPEGVKINQDVNKKFVLDVQDIPAIPEEDFMPPPESARYQVSFYYTLYHNATQFWNSEGKTWSKEVDHFAEVNDTLRSAVAKLIAPADSEEEKASKLYDAVQALENTDYTRSRSMSELKQDHTKEIKRAEDVWNQKRGNSNEIARLYLALLRAAGIKASAIQVVKRNRARFNAAYLSMNQFDDYLVIVNIAGKEMFTDPGEKMCPFGQLRWNHQATGGIRQGEHETLYSETPTASYKENTVTRNAVLKIDEKGEMSGSVAVIMSGPEALHWRQRALENDEGEVKKKFLEGFRHILPEGVQAEFDHFLGLGEPKSNLVAIVKVNGSLGTVTGKRLFLPGLFFESRTKHPFVATEKRQTSVDMRYTETHVDKVNYYLPEGYSAESAPTEGPTQWPKHTFLSIKSTIDGRNVAVERVLVNAFVLADSKEYNELRSFYQKVAAADQQQLVLKMGAPVAAKSN
jgi:hypothetical protein